MIRNCILLFVLYFVALDFLLAQIRFIGKYEIKGYDNAYFTTIKATDTCYWAFGIIWDTTAPYFGGTSLFKFDLQGKLAKQKDLISKTQFYGFNNDMYAIKNKLFTSTLVPYSASSIIAYDILADSFQTLTTVRNLLPDGDFLSINNLHFDLEGNCYLANSVSSTNATDSYTQIQLVKFTPKFNVEWSKILGNTRIDEIPYSITTDSLGNVYVGAQRIKLNYVEGDNNYSRSIVYKLSSDGKIEKETIADSLSGPIYDLIVDDQAKYICASEVLLPYDSERPFPFPALKKLDADGKILFRKYFQEVPNKEKVYSHFNKVIKVRENYYALGGLGVLDEDIYPEVAESRAILVKFNEMGGLIWKRIYNTASGVEGTNLYDFDITTDRGFILAGLGSLGTKDGIDWKAMLLKVDSFGCLVPGCQLMDYTDKKVVQNRSFKIFPNPVSDYLAFYNPTDQKLRISIIDLKGTVLYKFISCSKETKIIDLCNYPVGSYFIQSTSNNKFNWTEKFVKE